jgi:hypothetical protein
MASRILLDTNLLVLLIVGSTSERSISTHKRTRAYVIASFRLLSAIVDSPSKLISTPHILAETSNLIRQCAEPLRSGLSTTFAASIAVLSENHVAARQVVSSRHFQRLGLTDATVLEFGSADVALLTDDLDLYHAAAKAGMVCENFSHLRAAHAL